jgi:phosphate transport system protein
MYVGQGELSQMASKEISPSSSSRAVFDRDLQELRENVLRMADLLKSAVLGALTALREGNPDIGEKIIEGDLAVNNMRYKIENDCLHMIATQQPAAGDLRAIVAGMNLAGDMERMGDYAAGIAKVFLRMDDTCTGDLPHSLDEMAELVLSMLNRAIKAYEEADDTLAYEVASIDTQIDEHYHALYSELVERITNNPGKTTDCLYLMFIGHNLERFADRATNLAEHVIFMTSGKIQELNPEDGLSEAN